MSNILKNEWYLAAWSDELADKPLGRKICGIPMVLFRAADGTAAAMRDRCPHRLAPLSVGDITPQGIECPYHGLVFDGRGNCVHNPFGPAPAAAKVETYPLVEKDSCVWVWYGDPALADESKITDYSHFLKGDRRPIWLRVTLNGQLMLGVENLLDLTHSSFLHVPTISVWETYHFKDAHLTTDWDGEWLKARWSFDKGRDGNNFWIQSDWKAPGIMWLSSSTDPSGKYRDPPYTQIHVFTPETETTTHYFTADVFESAVETFEEAQARAKLLSSEVFDEDDMILSAIQDEMGDRDFFEMDPVLLSIDKAAVIARRHFNKLLAEQGAMA